VPEAKHPLDGRHHLGGVNIFLYQRNSVCFEIERFLINGMIENLFDFKVLRLQAIVV
jgi:hypothetical protein